VKVEDPTHAGLLSTIAGQKANTKGQALDTVQRNIKEASKAAKTQDF
jgi:hypothetical protein